MRISVTLQVVKVTVGIKTVTVDLNDADCDVGAMVGNTLQIHGNIGKHKSLLDRTFSLLESADMVCLYDGIDIVDDLLKRLHSGCLIRIVRLKGIDGQVQDLLYRVEEYAKFLLCLAGELHFFFLHLFCGIFQVHAVIGNTLKISDAV